MSAPDDRDKRGVFIAMWHLDLVDGDTAAALLLAQLLWYFQPSTALRSRMPEFVRNGEQWLHRAEDEWYDDCRLSGLQVRRIRKVLLDRNLVFVSRFGRKRAPISAWRPNYETINAAAPDDPASAPKGHLVGKSTSAPGDDLVGDPTSAATGEPVDPLARQPVSQSTPTSAPDAAPASSLLETERSTPKKEPPSPTGADTTSPNGRGPHRAEAHALTELAWKQPKRPVIVVGKSGNEFCAVRDLYERHLDAGESVERLSTATIAGIEVWSLRGMATALALLSNGNGKAPPNPNRGVTTDRSGKSGRFFV